MLSSVLFLIVACLKSVVQGVCLCKESLVLVSGSVEVCAARAGRPPLPHRAKPQKPLEETTTHLVEKTKISRQVFSFLDAIW